MSEDGAPTASRGQVFVARLTSTLVLWGLVTVAISLGWDWLFFVLIGGLGFLGLFECLKLFEVQKERRYFWWTLSIGMAYLAATFHYTQNAPSEARTQFFHLDIFFICALLFGLFILSLFKELRGDATLRRILGSLFCFLYTIILFLFLARILYLPEKGGVYYALYCLAVTKFTDMGAYAIGSLCGKHKLIPHISPGKTWEGLGGAFLGAYVASVAIYFPFKEHMDLLDLTHVMILPLILGTAAIIGDLAESVIKRCSGVKDSGQMLPGIGGVVDLIDSVCFTAPVLYLYLHILTNLSA